MKKVSILASAVSAAVVLALSLVGALAQVPSTSPPYNVDLGAVITNTAQAPGTVTSAKLNNLDKSGVICTLNLTATPGAPQVTFSIQNFDSASGLYYTIVTSGTITQVNTPASIVAHDGVQTSSLPAAVSATVGLPLSRYWRVSETVTSAGSTATGTIGCNQVK